MVFRGQNYLSSAIRRVGKDVGMLSRGQQVSMQRAGLQAAGQRLRITRAQAYLEERSVRTGGKRNLDLQKAIAAQKRAQLRTEAVSMENQQRLSRMTRVVGQRGNLPGFTAAESQQMLAAQQKRAQAAAQAVKDEQLSTQELTARQARLAETESILSQRRKQASRDIDANREAQERLNYEETRIDPVRNWQAKAGAIEHAGRVLQMFGLIASASIGFAADQAAKLQTNITLAATQARQPGAPISNTAGIATRVQKQILDLMGQLPFSGQDFSDAFYQVFSGTNIQSIPKATNLIKTFGQAAVAGGTDLKTMVDAGITMHNVFGNEFPNATKAANAFFAAVRYGRMNAEQFANALPNVAAIAKRVGLSFNDIAGAMALLTRQTGGKFTSRDATGIARMVEILGRPDFVAGAKKMGINIKDLHGNMRPLLDIITEISDKTKGEGGIALLNLFKTISGKGSATGTGGTQGTIQARRAFAFLISDIDQYRKVAGQVTNDNDEMVKSFEAMQKTPGVQWQLFINQMKILVYEIGIHAIPVLVKFGEHTIVPLVRYFNSLSDSTKKWVASLLTVVSVGSLVVGTLGAMGGGIARLVTAFVLMRRLKSFQALAQGAATKGAGSAAGDIVSSEAGFALVGKGGLALGIPAAILLMVRYHQEVSNVVTALGGLRNVLMLVNAAIVAFAVTRALGGMSMLVGELNIAATAALGLQTRLLALARLSPIAIAVLLSILPEVKTDKAITDSGNRNFAENNPVSKAFTKIPFGVGKLFGYANRAVDILGQKEGLLPSDAELRAKEVSQQTEAGRITGVIDMQVQRNKQNAARALRLANQAAALRKREQAQMAANRAAGVGARPGDDVQAWISRIEKLRKANLGDPTDLSKAKAYEQAVNQLNKRFKDQPALLSAINDVLGSFDNNLKQSTKSANTLGVTFQDVLSNIQTMYDNMLQQNQQSFGTLFQGPFVQKQDKLQFGGLLTGQDLVKDLRSQMTQFKTFNSQIQQLSRRGAPPELLKQLTALGPAALQQIQALNKLSPSQLKGYFKLFSDAQKIIHDQTMKDLRRQLKQYNKYGKNIALQIVAGLRSEQPAMTKALTKLVHDMFPGLPVGATGAGGKPTHHPANSSGGHTTNNYKTEMHVHGEPTQQQMVKADHALFRAKNKYRPH